MNLRRLPYHLIEPGEAEDLDLDALDGELLRSIEPLFDANLSVEHTLGCELGEVRVSWTGSPQGQGMFTLMLGEVLYNSGILLAGRDAAGDAAIAEMFTQATQHVEVIEQLGGFEVPPHQILTDHTHRPLLLSVIWPFIAFEQYEQIMGLDVLLAAVFLRRLEGQSEKASTPTQG